MTETEKAQKILEENSLYDLPDGPFVKSFLVGAAYERERAKGLLIVIANYIEAHKEFLSFECSQTSREVDQAFKALKDAIQEWKEK